MSGPRFSVMPWWVFTHRAVKPMDLKVLGLLCRHTNKQGWCTRSQTKLAKALGCARSTVQLSMDRLVKIGILIVRPNVTDDGRKCSHTYRVLLDYDPPNLSDELEGEDVEDDDELPDEIAPTHADRSAYHADPRDRHTMPIHASACYKNAHLITPIEERERESAGARGGFEGRQDFERQETKTSKPETGKAALEKRVQRFCSGAGFKAGAWPDWDTGASFGYVAGRFEALSEAERETAERWRDAYLADVARRGKAAVKVGNFLRDRMWEALDPRLLTAFEAAPVAASNTSELPEGSAPAWGPVWGARLIGELLAGPRVELANRSGFWLRSEIEQGYPSLIGLFRATSINRQSIYGPQWHALAPLLEPVPVGSAKWQEWMAVWKARGWPSLPDTGNQKVVYLPRGDTVAAALQAFQVAAGSWQSAIENQKTGVAA